MIGSATPNSGDRSLSIAAGILRGARRLLSAMGYASVCELVLPNGRRADIAAVSASGQIIIVEIKSSAADFRSDAKWPEYKPYCDQLYFGLAADGPVSLIPEDAGLIIADPYSGEIVRSAPPFVLMPARRRSVLLAFARHAADRLHLLQDPDKTPGAC